MSNATMPYQQGSHDWHPGDHGAAPAAGAPGPHAAGGAPAMGPHATHGQDDHAMGAHPAAAHAGAARAQGPAHHGRDKIDWGPEVWKRIDAAVKDEIARSRVAAKVLPAVHVPAKATTVPADVISQQMTEERTAVNALSVDETATTRVNEYWVEFSLTPAQVEEESAAAHGGAAHAHPTAPTAHGQVHPGHHPQHAPAAHHGHVHASTGVSLATRAANFLAQVEDSVIFQGQNALQSGLLGGSTTPVNFRVTANTLDLGLLNLLLPGRDVSAAARHAVVPVVVPVQPGRPGVTRADERRAGGPLPGEDGRGCRAGLLDPPEHGPVRAVRARAPHGSVRRRALAAAHDAHHARGADPALDDRRLLRDGDAAALPLRRASPAVA